jgi:hypothetical protein
MDCEHSVRLGKVIAGFLFGKGSRVSVVFESHLVTSSAYVFALLERSGSS